MEVNRIILGDCLETISFLDDGIADLIILDPNYNDWDKLC
jgi:predicted methyltransferase